MINHFANQSQTWQLLMPQRIAMSSSKYPPKTQKKQNNQIDLLPIINDNKLLYKKAKVYRNGDTKWTQMNFNLPQTTKNFPQRKNTPKSHSCSQVKTSELIPSAECHFVGNYSIRAHYKASGSDVQDLWRRCTYCSRLASICQSSPVLKTRKPAGTRSVTVQ